MKAESTLTRRRFLTAAGVALAGLTTASIYRGPGALLSPRRSGRATVRMWTGAGGSHVGFDPVGLQVAPGTTVRWVLDSGAHSTTAYHPDHDRPRRIPLGAAPWDSGILFEPEAEFSVRLQAPGVYDAFCHPHEAAGMVCRIVVGTPGVDFELPAWARPGAPAPELAPAARGAFPPVDRIVERGLVPGLPADSLTPRGEGR